MNSLTMGIHTEIIIKNLLCPIQNNAECLVLIKYEVVENNCPGGQYNQVNNIHWQFIYLRASSALNCHALQAIYIHLPRPSTQRIKYGFQLYVQLNNMLYHVIQETQHIHKTNNVNATKQSYQAADDNLLLGHNTKSRLVAGPGHIIYACA